MKKTERIRRIERLMKAVGDVIGINFRFHRYDTARGYDIHTKTKCPRRRYWQFEYWKRVQGNPLNEYGDKQSEWREFDLPVEITTKEDAILYVLFKSEFFDKYTDRIADALERVAKSDVKKDVVESFMLLVPVPAMQRSSNTDIDHYELLRYERLDGFRHFQLDFSCRRRLSQAFLTFNEWKMFFEISAIGSVRLLRPERTLDVMKEWRKAWCTPEILYRLEPDDLDMLTVKVV